MLLATRRRPRPGRRRSPDLRAGMALYEAQHGRLAPPPRRPPRAALPGASWPPAPWPASPTPSTTATSTARDELDPAAEQARQVVDLALHGIGRRARRRA